MTDKLQLFSRVALMMAVAVMVACSWISSLDSVANEQVDTGLKRALASFATARVLNGVISVAQGTEVTAQLIGGVNLSVGEILDPVNDLVEKFSDLMLIASIAFGIQKVLLSIGSHQLISFLFTATAVIWAVFYFRQKQCPGWLTKLLVVLLMMRFAIPVVSIGSDLAFQKFMAHDYQSSQKVITTASGFADKPTEPVVVLPKEEKSLFERVKCRMWFPCPAADNPVEKEPAATPPESKSMTERIKDWFSLKDMRSRVEDLRQLAEQATEHIIKLMVIFVLQTLVIPVLLLWSMYSLARGVFERPGKALS